MIKRSKKITNRIRNSNILSSSVEQFDRLSKYSLNPDNQKMYANKKEQ
ncbi:MAG: hypothetical protein ACLR7D_12830 [Lachnospira eligens]